MKYELINALVTPFDDNNQIDFDILKKLIKKTEHYHDGYLIAGSTGEGDSLTEKEVQSLIDFLALYKFQKILCICEDCTQKVIDKISSLKIPKDFKILLRIPCYYLPKESGIIKHFVQIFNRFKQYQFIIYDIKKRTNSTISIDGYKKICNNCKNFYGIKDCNNDFFKIEKLSKFTNVYCGNDEKIKEYLKHGAIGHISVCSIFEENYFLNLDSKLNFEYSKFPNPIGIKKKLKELGFSSMNLRLPLDF